MIKLLEDLVGIGLVNFKTYSGFEVYSSPDCGLAIKSAMTSVGLGKKDINFPLLDIINPGEIVLIKPNWVNHKNYNKNQDVLSLYTHPKFIENILDQLEGCHPGKVIIGDAPIQGCVFNQIVPDEWIKVLQTKYSFPIELIDFRQTILKRDPLRKNLPVSIENINRKKDDFLLFDVESYSSLEEITDTSKKFRVTMYDHRKLNKKHQKGIHQYLIAKELFEADVIINVPKLKTHKKAGMTGALKNLVGINGSKDFLPHHRVGGSKMGGDNYPGFSITKRANEYFIDKANMKIGKKGYQTCKRIGSYLSKIAKIFNDNTDYEGSWYGNDTTWRMVLDLNKIILYGNQTGELSPTPLRRVYTITDAIIAGDTEGPLSVEPVKLGMVTFSSSSAFADLVHATLMNFNWKKIPCIREAFELSDFPIVQHRPEDCRVVVNGKEIKLEELSKKYGKPFRPSKYWKGHIELD